MCCKFNLFCLYLQTDDKGVFSTSLTEEYCIAADTFQLSYDQIWQLSYNSINHVFSDDQMKNRLRKKWDNFKEEVLEKMEDKTSVIALK